MIYGLTLKPWPEEDIIVEAVKRGVK